MPRVGWTVLLLFVVALTVFRASPRGQLYDSRYTLLVAHQLVQEGSPRLDAFVPSLGGVAPDGRPNDYRIVAHGDAYHWFYPPGSALIAAPFVALADLFDRGPVDGRGQYDRRNERRLQRWLAAGAMALVGVLFLLTAREALPLRPSLVVAGSALFASPVWSTTSRSLWSQSATVLLLSAVTWLLVRGRRPDTPVHPIALASLLAWAWLCRPTAVVPALGVTLYVALRRRESLAALVATGAAWLGVFLVFFAFAYGSVLPPYHQLGSHAFRVIPEALLGNLVSPARGLLVYCPILLVVASLTSTRWRALDARPLAVLAVGVITGHWLLVSSHAPWWGGYGYGPRLMSETVPWLVVLATLAWATLHREAPARRTGLRVAVATLLALGVVLHGIGAISRRAADWNHRQGEPGFEAVLWRLDEAPFLAPFARADPDRSTGSAVQAPIGE